MSLAPFLTDPKTGKPFDPNDRPCRLEAVVRGWDTLYNPKPKLTETDAIRVEFIRDAYRAKPEAFKRAGLSQEAVKRILAGDRPSLGELIQLQEALDIPMDKLFGFYGISLDSPLPKQGNGAKSSV